MRRHFAGPTLRFETRQLDLAQAAAQCDVAITNANHGTTATMLMAGKPALLVPIVLEQGLMARRIRRLGAGLDASSKRPDMIVQRLRRLLDDPRFAEAARRAGATYASFDPARQRQEIAAPDFRNPRGALSVDRAQARSSKMRTARDTELGPLNL